MTEIPKVSFREVLFNSRTILKNPLIFHREKFRQVGDTFKVRASASHQFVLSRDSNLAVHILQKNHKNYEKSTLQTVDLARYIGHGLLTSNGDHWLVHRRMIQPGFSKKKMNSLFEIIYRAVVAEVEGIDMAKGQDVFPRMSDLAFQVVAKSLFSRSDIHKRMKRLQVITLLAQQMLIKEMRQPYLRWWFRLNGNIRKHLNYANEARGIIEKLITERRLSGEEKDDLLDMLLSARYEDGKFMSNRQLIDEVMILFAAGHETTANALSFTLFHIAKDKRIQNLILEEANRFDFDSEDLGLAYKALPITKNCIEEAMRLYPPAYIIDRVAKQDDEYEGMKISTGDMILISLFEIQRDKRFWNNPLQFDPLRFDQENKKEYSGRYFPFGAGPRMCVGNHFAMFEMIVAIAHLVKIYKIDTKMEEIELIPLISLKPDEVLLDFTKR